MKTTRIAATTTAINFIYTSVNYPIQSRSEIYTIIVIIIIVMDTVSGSKAELLPASL